MSTDRTLARGARVFGTVVLVVLALLSLGWIVRDALAAQQATDLWWQWSGLPVHYDDGPWATSFLEPVLLVLYLACAATVGRSSSAAGILAAAGALTVLLRAYNLRNLGDDWLQGEGGVLHDRALVSVLAMSVLGLALLVTAAAGRRPVEEDPGGYGHPQPPAPAQGGPAQEGPAQPTLAGGIIAFLMLAGSSGALAAWEIHTMLDEGWRTYLRAVAGEQSGVVLLLTSSSATGWVLAVLCLVAAVAAVAAARFARPLGMAVSWPLAMLGVFYGSYVLRTDLLERLGELSTRDQLRIALAGFEILAGVVAVLALAPRRPRTPDVGDGRDDPYGLPGDPYAPQPPVEYPGPPPGDYPGAPPPDYQGGYGQPPGYGYPPPVQDPGGYGQGDYGQGPGGYGPGPGGGGYGPPPPQYPYR